LLQPWAYTLPLWNIAGFLISSVLFLVSAMLMFGERRIKVIIPAAVISSAVIYFLFTEAFMLFCPAYPVLN
jgi:multisubunit Na+/H+ antiporter MnhC subunit